MCKVQKILIACGLPGPVFQIRDVRQKRNLKRVF